MFPLLVLAGLLATACVEPEKGSDTSPSSDGSSGSTAGPEPTSFGPETSDPATTDVTTGDPTSTTAGDNLPPKIEFLRVLDDGVALELPTTITAPATLTIDVYASDPDGEVSEIQVKIGNTEPVGVMAVDGHAAMPWLIATSGQNVELITISAIALDDVNTKSAMEEVELSIDLHSGTEIWEHLSPSPDNTEFRAVAFNPIGEIVAVGRRFDEQSNQFRLYIDILSPLDGTSVLEEVDLAQPEGAIEGHGVAIDPNNGDLLVVGRREFEGKYHPFFRRLQQFGHHLTAVDETIFDYEGGALAITTDPTGAAYVTGYEGILDQGSRAFVTKIVGMSSQWESKVYLGNPNNDETPKRGAGFDIMYAPDDKHIYVGGVHTVLDPIVYEGMLVLRMTTSGAVAQSWISEFMANNNRQEARSIAMTPEGKLYAGGLSREDNEYAINLLRMFSIEDNELKDIWTSTYPLPSEAGALDRVIYGIALSPKIFPDDYRLAVAATIHQSDDIDQIEPMRSAWVSDLNYAEPWWGWSWDRPVTQAFDIGWAPDGFHYTVGFHDGEPRQAWLRKSVP